MVISIGLFLKTDVHVHVVTTTCTCTSGYNTSDINSPHKTVASKQLHTVNRS